MTERLPQLFQSRPAVMRQIMGVTISESVCMTVANAGQAEQYFETPLPLTTYALIHQIRLELHPVVSIAE